MRQLESLVRLSEAMARAHLSDKVLDKHVDAAFHLVRRSMGTVAAAEVAIDDPEELDALMGEVAEEEQEQEQRDDGDEDDDQGRRDGGDDDGTWRL